MKKFRYLLLLSLGSLFLWGAFSGGASWVWNLAVRFCLSCMGLK